MMLSGLAKLFKRDHREFETFQIEVSSYSSLESQFSPRVVFAEKWLFQQMSLETYQKIAHHFPRVKWVIFRGWGDPLENEDFPTMFHLARETGCLTGLATHGFYLTPEISRQLVEGKLDFITLNLKEIPPAGEEDSRISSEFKQTLDQIRHLIELKKSRGQAVPSVRLSFIMTRLNMSRLGQIVPAAVKLGADEVIVKNLDYLPEDRWNILRTFYHESPTPAFQDTRDEILRLGKELKMPVRYSPLKAEEIPVCEAEPHRSLFFSVDGSIAPCMYLRLPKKGKIPRIFLNRDYSVDPVIFGNINAEELPAVWGKEDYRSFRKVFEDRLKAQRNAASIFDAVSNPGSALQEIIEPPPLCESCRTCYKAYGI
jgi:MoaA/NifB/PqqE/SkfB family radical SAM enzyme